MHGMEWFITDVQSDILLSAVVLYESEQDL
jgi:hypothetical protein